MSWLGYPNPLSKVILTLKQETDWLQDIRESLVLKKNKEKQVGIAHRQDQSCCTHHLPSKVLTESSTPPSEEGK